MECGLKSSSRNVLFKQILSFVIMLWNYSSIKKLLGAILTAIKLWTKKFCMIIYSHALFTQL